MFDYDDLRAEQQRASRRQATRCSSASASPPSPRCAGWRRRGSCRRCKYVAGGWEHATVRMLPTGKVEVVTGTSPHGQGHVTAWSQIAADALGVDVRRHRRHLRRHRAPRRTAWTPTARGRWPSAGWRCVAAAERVVEKARVIAAHMLEADPDDLEFTDGVVQGQGVARVDEDDPGGRVRGVHRRTTCPTASSRPCRRARPSTRRPSRSRTARTCARSRSTPRPA